MSSSADRSVRTVRRRAARALAILACAAAATVAAAGSASAHAELVSSNPANGATLASPPASVVLRFDEEIAARFSSARLVDGTGETVSGVAQRISTDARTLTLSLTSAAVPDGAYGVLWRVVAEDDGHASTGALAFSIGSAGAATAAATASGAAASAALGTATTQARAGWVDSARRALGVLSLSLVIGGLAVAGLILPRGPAAAAARRRVLRLVVAASAAGVVVGLADLVSEVSQLDASGGTALGGLLGQTRWGRLWLLQELTLVAVGVLGLLVLRTRRRLGVAFAGAAVVLAASEALGSHAAAQSHLAVAILTLHVLAACTWVGALPALVLVHHRELLRDSRLRISWLLGSSVCVLVASGLYSAGWGVAQLGSITATAYGQTLLVKVALVLVALTVAAVNSARLHDVLPLRSLLPGRRSPARPTPARRPPSARTLGLEIGALLLVVGATGVLVESPPARGPAPAPAPVAAARPATGGASSGDLVISLVVTPNQPGLNAFSVLARSTRRPDPAPVQGVVLHLDQAGTLSTITLRENGPGQYFGTGLLAPADHAAPSSVGLTVEVGRGASSTTVHLPWAVAPVPPVAGPAPRPAPPRRTAPYADGLALVVLAAGLLTAVAALRRRTRSERAAATPEADARQLEPSR